LIYAIDFMGRIAASYLEFIFYLIALDIVF